METFSIKSTSANSAECDLIVLREKSQRRLIFRPELVKKPETTKPRLSGTFIYQRKRQNEQWEDHHDLPLSKLRADEWVRLDLISDELDVFLRNMGALWRHRKYGMPRGRVTLLKINEDQFENLQRIDVPRILKLGEQAGVDVLGDFLDWLAGSGDPKSAMERLSRLDQSSLEQLGALARLSTLQAVAREWRERLASTGEEYWQKSIAANAFVLSQLVAHPLLILNGKVYVGGKGIDNRGGHVADYLATNPLTENAAIVEIKTPSCPLLGNREYRQGVFAPSDELVGAVNQVLTNRHSLMTKFDSLKEPESRYQVFRPQCLLIAGNIGAELDTEAKRRSFELFRHELKDVAVISFDELVAKLQVLVNALQGIVMRSDSA